VRKVSELEKQAAVERCKELITAYKVLSDEAARKKYDVLLSRDTVDDIESYKSSWVFVSNSGSTKTTLKSGDHNLEFAYGDEWIAEGGGVSYYILKESFDPFLKYLNDLTTRSDGLKKLPRYTSVAGKIDALSQKIKKPINDLESQANPEQVLKVLNLCNTILMDAQKDPEYNQHRGFLRRTPFFSQLFFVCDVILRILDFVLCSILSTLFCLQYVPPYKNEPYYGFFRAEKTKTAKAIDALANDVQSYITAINDKYPKL
jgi:hypothetical protein